MRGSAAACPGRAAYGGLAGALKTQAESGIKGREVFGLIFKGGAKIGKQESDYVICAG